jgi:hypothetical protein
MKTRYPKVVYANNGEYKITLVSPSKAVVEGGMFKKPQVVTKLLGDGDSNPKTAKNFVITKGLSLYPHKGVGFGNLCPHADTCIDPCLAHQGQGKMSNVIAGRAAKTVVYLACRQWFLAKLERELTRFRKSYPLDVKLGVRLNMLSDIPWEHYGIMDKFPDLEFYDYSKNPRRWGQLRPNYWVTFSFDGKNTPSALAVLNAGGNVAVVFHNEDGKCGKAAHRQTMPSEFLGATVIDGGVTDWRPDDPRGVIVGLRLLARTYADRDSAIDSGFSQLHSA